MNKTMRLMKQAASGVKSAAHFNLLFGQFQKTTRHLSLDLQDSANREFRRVAKSGWDRRKVQL